MLYPLGAMYCTIADSNKYLTDFCGLQGRPNLAVVCTTRSGDLIAELALVNGLVLQPIDDDDALFVVVPQTENKHCLANELIRRRLFDGNPDVDIDAVCEIEFWRDKHDAEIRMYCEIEIPHDRYTEKRKYKLPSSVMSKPELFDMMEDKDAFIESISHSIADAVCKVNKKPHMDNKTANITRPPSTARIVRKGI